MKPSEVYSKYEKMVRELSQMKLDWFEQHDLSDLQKASHREILNEVYYIMTKKEYPPLEQCDKKIKEQAWQQAKHIVPGGPKKVQIETAKALYILNQLANESSRQSADGIQSLDQES